MYLTAGPLVERMQIAPSQRDERLELSLYRAAARAAARRASSAWVVSVRAAADLATAAANAEDAAKAAEAAAPGSERAAVARAVAEEAADEARAASARADLARQAKDQTSRAADFANRADTADDVRRAAAEAQAAADQRRDRAGAVREAQTCAEFYVATRRKPAFYSTAAAMLPLATLLLALALAYWLSGRNYDWSRSSSCPGSGVAAASDWLLTLFTTGDLAGRLRFSASHAALIVMCLLALYFGLESTRRVRAVHTPDRMASWPAMLRDCCALAAALFILLIALFGRFVADIMQPFFGGLAADLGYCGTERMKPALLVLVGAGVFLVCVAVVALGYGVTALAYRYEHNDINGRWSDSYVLREKLNALLSLFFIAAALLVVGNIALSALLDSSLEIGGAAKDASDLMGPPAADLASRAKNAAAHIAAIKPLAAAISASAGVISSLLLIAMFVPGFLVLVDDIGVAGQTHASEDMHGSEQSGYVADLSFPVPGPNARISGRLTPPEPDPLKAPYRVAGWKVVNDWKAKHGLTMSFTDLTASFVAVAAPILSTPIVDLSKTLVGH